MTRHTLLPSLAELRSSGRSCLAWILGCLSAILALPHPAQAVDTPPVFTSQPASKMVLAGQTAAFSVTASGSPTPTYQWQRSNDGGAAWTDLTGATGGGYVSAATALGDTGAQFRCQATNVAGSATSNVAMLTVLSTDGGLFVNGGWAGVAAGQDPDGAGPAVAMGVDAFATIQQAINAAPAGSVIHISAGTYPENLTVTKTLTLEGPSADPVHGVAPQVILRPTVRTTAYVEVGDTTDQAACTPSLTMNHIRIDGSGVAPKVVSPNVGMNLRKGAYLKMSKCHVYYVRFAKLGSQTGWGIIANGASADIEDTLFSDFGKGALQCFGSGTINLRRNTFMGADMTNTYQMSLECVTYNELVRGEIDGNLFLDFDPSGKYNAAAGGAMVADDLSVGYVLLIKSDLTSLTDIVVTNNTFNSVQAVFADWRIVKSWTHRAASITGERFFAANNQVVGGRYIVMGAMNEGTFIFGDRAEDPNILNYALAILRPSYFMRSVVTLANGIEYRLGHDLIGRDVDITLESVGTSTLVLPNRTEAQGITFASSVTVRYLPAVDIIAPVKQSQVSAGVGIPVEIAVRDLDGTSASVTLYDGTTPLQTWSAAPYTCTITSLAEGFHNLTAVAVDDTGLSATSAITPIVVGAAPSSIYWEFWKGITGTAVSSLLLLDRFPLSPDQQALKDVFEGPRDSDMKYGTRMRGYVVPPATGGYYFWITADDTGELWLSPDDKPEHKAKVAWATGSAFRGWTTGTARSAVVQLEAGKKYYVETLHTQSIANDHLSVGWTLPDGTQERPIPGNRLLPYIDTDNDQLDQWDELNIYHTDPNQADTDNDGLSDEEEVLISKTSPTEPNAVELVASTPGSAAVIATGLWQVRGEEIVSTSYNGSLEFPLAIGTADVYRIRMDLVQGTTNAYTNLFDLRFYIDGEYVAKDTLELRCDQDGSAVVYTPWLGAGQHVVRVVWYNVYPWTSLVVKRLNLYRISGPDLNENGVKDWIETRNQGMNTIDTTVVTSPVSPACLEGGGLYLSRMAITAGSQGVSVPVQPNTDSRWYANIPLDPAGATPVSVRFQDGLETHTHAITWTVTDVLHTTSATIRVGDALQLSAVSNGVSVDAPVTLTITRTGADPVVLQTTSGSSAIQVFGVAGTWTVQASLLKEDGTSLTGSLAVKVLSTTMPAAPILWLSNTRTWSWSGLDSGIVVTSSGMRMYEKSNTNGTRSYDMRTDDLDSQPVIVARTSAGGPILGSLRSPVFNARVAVLGYVKVVQVFEDGSTMIEGTLHMSSVPVGTAITLTINAGGALFLSGTLTQNLSPASFDDMGTYTYYVIRPAGKTTTCHFISFLQNGVSLGTNL